MRRLNLRAVILLVATLALNASFGNFAQAAERPLNLRIIQSGHSLTDPIPDPLRAMIVAAGNRGAVVDRSTIPGSPMDWRWNNAPSQESPNARTAMGDYDVLVLTERVPLSNTLPWHNSPEQALMWYELAATEGNAGQGAETVLYASWVGIDSGPDAENPHNDPEAHIPFRERLDREMAGWEKIQSHVNENSVAGSPPMRMIPGPLLMAEIYDAIKDGTVPDLSDISDLFSDDIHINDLGAYYIALAHYAVIFERDPRGLPNRLGMPSSPSRALADWMQETVWRVVSEYEGAGINAGG